MKTISSGICIIAMFMSLPATHALTPDEARHVLHRVGYGVTAKEWNAIIGLSRDEAVDLIVSQATVASTTAPPEWVSERPLYAISQRGWSEDKRRKLRIRKRGLMAELRNWWLYQMYTTNAPLRERMVVFWSNHFTTQFNKIKAPMLIYQQHALLREHSMGSFDDMLSAMLRDPAMLLYLDNDKNKRDRINENLARELMELFTLGEGNYTEDDVKEAARALTGLGVERQTGEFVMRLKHHDTGRKNILGKTAKFDGNYLADWLLQQSPTAQRIVTKLWLEFISLEPDPVQVRDWASKWQKNDYAIDDLLRMMFKSDAFWAPENRAALIKSPTELYAGIIRPALQGNSAQKIKHLSNSRPGKRLVSLMRKSGQELFNPPSVEGWEGGLSWLDSRTLLMRESTVRNIVLALAGNNRDNMPYATSLRMNDASNGENGRLATTLMWHLNALPPVTNIPATMTERRALMEIMRDPTVHLK